MASLPFPDASAPDARGFTTAARDRRVVVTYRPPLGPAHFLAPAVAAVWGAGLVAGTVYFFQARDLQLLLLMVLLGGEWLAFLGYAQDLWRRRAVLTLGEDGLHYQDRCLIPWSRSVALAEIKALTLAVDYLSGPKATEARREEHYLRLQTTGRPLRLFAGAPQPALAKLGPHLIAWLEARRIFTAWQESPPLEMAAAVPGPPWECGWEYILDGEGVELVCREQLPWEQLAPHLALGFWINLTLALFLLTIVGLALPGWRVTVPPLPVLILFVAFAAWGQVRTLRPLLAPLWAPTWRFGPEGLTRTAPTWSGDGRRTFPLAYPCHLTPVPQPGGSPHVQLSRLPFLRGVDPAEPYQLAVHDRHGGAVTAVTGLTEGEARWLAAALAAAKPAWFRPKT